MKYYCQALCRYPPMTLCMNDLSAIYKQFRCNLYGGAMTDALCVYYTKLVSIEIECLAHNRAIACNLEVRKL